MTGDITFETVLLIASGLATFFSAFTIAIVRYLTKDIEADATEAKQTANGSSELAEKMTKEISELSGKLDGMQATVDAQAIEIETLNDENKKLKGRVTHLEQENERKDKIITEVQSKLINANEERDAFRKDRDNKQRLVTEKDKQIIRLEAQVDALTIAKKESQDNALRMIEALSKIRHVVTFHGDDSPPPSSPSPITPLAKYKDDDKSDDDKTDDNEEAA